MNKLSIFPLIKKYNLEDQAKPEDLPDDEIQKLAFHYTLQLIQHFKNHEFPDTGFFYQDMDFLNEILECILLRSAGKHHDLQDLIDQIMQTPEKETEDDEESEKEV